MKNFHHVGSTAEESCGEQSDAESNWGHLQLRSQEQTEYKAEQAIERSDFYRLLLLNWQTHVANM